ncbi:MAG TPA: L-lactate permease [Gemmataceae bacterium]|nr:L-lactate permease [Gemmataceae bacterium]
MLWAVFHQRLNPLADKLPASSFLSTVLAALPVVVLFWLLVPRRWLAPKAGAMAALTALVIAIIVYGMHPLMAGMAFVDGALFGLLPVGWTIFNAMLLYNVTVQTGKFDIVRRSVAGLSGDARVQAILIAFAFGAFLEGAAGGGTPVAICGAIMVGLGFDPFLAAVLCLIANTSPVAYGGLGTPLITLNGVTGLSTETLSVMAGHQLPLLSLFVPLYMIKCMCSWKQTWEVWPALLVAGGSFAVFQFTFATIHTWPGLKNIVLYPMTDIGGGIFSLVVTAIFLKFWKPRKEWHFEKAPIMSKPDGPVSLDPNDPHAAEVEALLGSSPPTPPGDAEPPLNAWNITVAWFPFVLMSILLLLTGLVRQREGERKTRGPAMIGPVETNYIVPIPWLDKQSFRDARLHEGDGEPEQPESATFNFAWLTAPGSAVFAAAILSMALLRMNRRQIGWVFKRTFVQMKIPIPTICFMLGLSYVTRYAGMDATLGFAFASSGLLYPFFAPLLGWLGVFLTGTDAGSNALFGSLQKITATQIYNSSLFRSLNLGQLQVLICTSNSTGGVMGKMIDAQSIVVATAATNQLGKEADIFKAVFWHSILLAVIVGLLTLVQAYVYPFTLLVPHLPR